MIPGIFWSYHVAAMLGGKWKKILRKTVRTLFRGFVGDSIFSSQNNTILKMKTNLMTLHDEYRQMARSRHRNTELLLAKRGTRVSASRVYSFSGIHCVVYMAGLFQRTAEEFNADKSI